MEVEVTEYMPISNNDFINIDLTTTINYYGGMIFQDTHISNINDDSIIFSYLNDIIKKKNINKNNYDIYFQRNKEWFNKFIFYKKNKL
jgi:hypothetical protein